MYNVVMKHKLHVNYMCTQRTEHEANHELCMCVCTLLDRLIVGNIYNNVCLCLHNTQHDGMEVYFT